MIEVPTPTSIFDRYPALREIPAERFPHHVFIIPDGNRRSAAKIGQEPLAGHESGLIKTLELLRVMRELPVEIVTLWGFSADNWKRPEDEKTGLMHLFDKNIPLNLPELIGNDARFVHLGRKDRIPEGLAKTLQVAERETRNNSGQIVCVAIDFGGKDQEERIVRQSARIAAQIARLNPEMSPEEISKLLDEVDTATALRDTSGLIPPADLIIRTSERRTSDVGWINGPQTELFFLEDKFFPELTDGDIVDAMVYFSQRNRRLGK